MAGENSNRMNIISIVLSILFGLFFGIIHTATIIMGVFDGLYSNQNLEIFAYQAIVMVIIIMITPKRLTSAINNGVFFFISSTFYAFYCLFKTNNFSIWDVLYDLAFALIAFVVSLAVWQYKKSGWLSGICAAIPLSFLTCTCIYLIICLINTFSWLTIANICVYISFAMFFYTKITDDNATKIKTIVFHIVFSSILVLFSFWKHGIISFNI